VASCIKFICDTVVACRRYFSILVV